MDGRIVKEAATARGGFGVGACGFHYFDRFCYDGADWRQYRSTASDWPDD